MDYTVLTAGMMTVMFLLVLVGVLQNSGYFRDTGTSEKISSTSRGISYLLDRDTGNVCGIEGGAPLDNSGTNFELYLNDGRVTRTKQFVASEIIPVSILQVLTDSDPPMFETVEPDIAKVVGASVNSWLHILEIKDQLNDLVCVLNSMDYLDVDEIEKLLKNNNITEEDIYITYFETDKIDGLELPDNEYIETSLLILKEVYENKINELDGDINHLINNEREKIVSYTNLQLQLEIALDEKSKYEYLYNDLSATFNDKLNKRIDQILKAQKTANEQYNRYSG